ncbi:MAG: hypothetical protein DMG93_15180 [Acidobacteria bacterium]|nr:MAG: hypothetical protein DMG93_15180 [Acidobacteriota bacterium]
MDRECAVARKQDLARVFLVETEGVRRTIWSDYSHQEKTASYTNFRLVQPAMPQREGSSAWRTTFALL